MIDLRDLPELPAHPEVEKALRFARIAHAEQKRKYTGEDYYHHPIEVARIFLALYDGPDVISGVIGALLHDTVEDTRTTLSDIRYFFDEHIARIVDGLTDVSVLSDGNRATRKAMDREHTLAQTGFIKSIKCCDLISNTYSIAEHAPGFAKTYLAEKDLILDGMVADADTAPDYGCHSEARLVADISKAKLEKIDA